MRVAVVIQRYGLNVVGGAEYLARAIAEKLSSQLSWDVEVFTTTAVDCRTWKTHFEEGIEIINDIKVRRYSPLVERTLRFRIYHRVLALFYPVLAKFSILLPLRNLVEKKWYEWQGPLVPALIRDLVASADTFDRILFFGYCYYPAVFGTAALAGRAYLIPTAHDELAFQFKATERMLGHVKGILVNGVPEAQLIKKVYPNLNTPIIVAGLGIDATEARRRPTKPGYALYVGRLTNGKGVSQLISWFKRARESDQSIDLKLYLAGQRERSCPVESDNDVCYCGVVSEEKMRALYEEATLIVNPSPLESLSLLAIEAIALKKPVLLNERCHVFQYYAKQMEACFLYSDEQDFYLKLKCVLATDWDTDENQARLERSRQWVVSNYSWERVLAIYKSLQ